jgi:hypothetical protein
LATLPRAPGAKKMEASESMSAVIGQHGRGRLAKPRKLYRR